MNMSDAGRKNRGRGIAQEIAVGFFVIAIFAGLFLFTVVLNGASLFRSGGKTELDVQFDRVGGLRRHDTVLVRGMPVGQVDSLELEDYGVKVHLKLTRRIILRDTYVIRPESSSLLGGMQLVIEEGTGGVVPLDGILKGVSPENIMDNVNGAVTDIRQALNEGGVLTNLESIVADISELTHRLREGEGSLGKLLSTNDTVYVDLAGTIANLRSLTDRIERGEGTVGKLLSSDSTLYDDLQSAVADIRSMADRVEKGEGTLGKLFSSDSKLYDDLSDTIANFKSISERLEKGEGTVGKLLSSDDSLYADLHDTVSNLKLITGRLENGEGALGQLMRDDGALSVELNGLVNDGRDMIDDLRETSPISTFSSIFFGAL